MNSEDMRYASLSFVLNIWVLNSLYQRAKEFVLDRLITSISSVKGW
jgi:hypothetical protein